MLTDHPNVTKRQVIILLSNAKSLLVSCIWRWLVYYSNFVFINFEIRQVSVLFPRRSQTRRRIRSLFVFESMSLQLSWSRPWIWHVKFVANESTPTLVFFFFIVFISCDHNLNHHLPLSYDLKRPYVTTLTPCVRLVCATTLCTCGDSHVDINLCEQVFVATKESLGWYGYVSKYKFIQKFYRFGLNLSLN